MEEFKIIKLPNKKEDEEKEVDTPKRDKYQDGEYAPPKKKHVFLIILILIVIVSVIVIKMLTKYQDYEVEKSWDRNDSIESNFLSFNNNLLKYSADGVFYTAVTGELIWNYTYDMTNPNIDVCGNYIVVYDKKGNEIDIFSTKGHVKSITTTVPVMEAKVAKQGTISVLLQENNTSYIQLYDKDGDVLVSGEIHPENSGYPVSMALSSDATRLLLSIINVNEGEVSTELVFYDFTSAGKKEEDNIVSKHKYPGVLIPKVEYLKNDKAIAFADSKIIIYNNNFKATVAKEIKVSSDIKSIFYNDTHFGYVCEKAEESGKVVNEINVYNLYGFRWMNKEITEGYTDIKLLDNDEVCVINGEELTIYNLQGIGKFYYKFDESVYNVLPGTTSRRYYLIEGTKTEEIYIK
ncbi:MAG: DUF5711 family protein [Pseudobutyrivibrio sp.]|nr:DUF5711 family protein [Pseudobutyrivibrio sp.]